MTLRRIVVDRIGLTLDGLPADQAELLAAQLQDALAAHPFPQPVADGAAPDNELRTDLTGQALVSAVAARLMQLIASEPETPPWP